MERDKEIMFFFHSVKVNSITSEFLEIIIYIGA